MKEFRQKFIEDVRELIVDLEDNLLSLRNTPNDTELVSSIFRSLHTIKGSAGMFGFENITKIAHLLENIFQEIRSEKFVATKQIIQVTFNSIDFIKSLLDQKQPYDKKTKLQVNNIINKINELSPNIIDFLEIPDKNNKQIESNKFSTFDIIFKPKANFEQRGININDVFEELKEIGEFRIIEIPTSKDNKDNLFYIFWEIIIVTQKSISEIEDVFIFFQNEFSIQKFASQNLFLNKKFLELINESKNAQKSIKINELAQFIITKEKKETINNEIKLKKITKKNNPLNIIKTLKNYKTSSIRVSADKLDRLMNLVSELITTKATINIIAEKYDIKELTEISERMDKLAKNMQDNALNIRLVPISNMLTDMERLIFDLSEKLGKQIEFSSEGGETELDKNIVDNLSEPVMHIIRNCIDHGIEKTEQRIKLNKPEKGQIKLFAFHSAGNVFIQIHDDGKGIDTNLIQQTAIDKKIISIDDKLSKKEINSLIFHPGFTTAKTLTEISGRGVGMDIVKQKIMDLRGVVEINSEKNLGTYITLKLPLTLSIIDTLLVKINNSFFLIPKYLIENIHEIEKYETIIKNDYLLKKEKKIVPIVNLIKKYGNEDEVEDYIKLIVVKAKEQYYGLLVNNIIGNHQAVLKPIGEIFKTQEIFSSASILGDGNIALMFDINKLIEKN